MKSLKRHSFLHGGVVPLKKKGVGGLKARDVLIVDFPASAQ